VFATHEILRWYALRRADHLTPSSLPVSRLLTRPKNKREQCYSTSSTASGLRLLLWVIACDVPLYFSWSLSLNNEDRDASSLWFLDVGLFCNCTLYA
jgi:hypothetical protein